MPLPTTILLISINQCTTPYPVYPLGLSHVAASLRRHGHRVTMADMSFEADKLEEIVTATTPAFIGISLRNIDDQRIDDTVFFVPQLLTAIGQVRRISAAPIIIGGSAYSLFPESLLAKSGADYGIVGEGDEAMPKLVGLLAGKASGAVPDLASVPGLVYRQGTAIVRNPPELLDARTVTAPYRQSNMFDYYLLNGGIANIQTQRGCPFTCCYCTYPVIEGTELRLRDPKTVVDEIEEVMLRGTRYVFFVDSVFNADTGHVAGLCDELIARNVGIAWGCFLRPAGVTREIMRLMARAGLRHVEFGTDSLSDPVLDAYGKQFTFDDILRADAQADAAQVRHAHFLINGGPGETESTLHEAFDNSLRLKKTVIFPYAGMRLYPGTALYRHVVREGGIHEQTDLLHPFFYITPGLSKERITAILESFHERSSRWIVKDPTPGQQQVIERLRAKNIPGPLWEFLAQ